MPLVLIEVDLNLLSAISVLLSGFHTAFFFRYAWLLRGMFVTVG